MKDNNRAVRDSMQHMQELENRIGYTFEQPSLLEVALTHPSYSGKDHYERLEFLGDAVLELSISDYLFENHPDLNEGALTQKRSEIVRAKTLVHVAEKIGLGGYLALGKGELMSGGREKPSILENAMEAVFGAVYLDGGYYPAKAVIVGLLHDALGTNAFANGDGDYKSQLQEMVQKTVKKDINYLVSNQEGPPHNMTFYVRLIVGGKVICEGIGSSKKEAEQNAAKFAIENFDKIYEGENGA